MRSVLIFFGFIATASAILSYDVLKEEWSAFKLQHGKKYLEIEERLRFKIFIENKFKIAKHNQLFAAGKVSFEMGVNKFADMLHQEFVKTMNGYNNTWQRQKSAQLKGTTFISPANVKLPDSVDWRTKGAVTEIKDQGRCGSCWAFSSTGSLEGQHFRKTGTLVSLSEQNLVDCSSKYGNNGCDGGLMVNSFLYIKNNGGIDTEKAYPYKGFDDSCHFNKKFIGATDTGFTDIPEGSEDKLKEAVATIGPIAVAIDASSPSFQFYKRGVYDEPMCDTEELGHAVLVIGYGTNSQGKDYWLVKNSWGTTWGDKGYIMMSRNKNNQCGIATEACYPLV